MPKGDRAFISYSRDDTDFVRRLASDLKAGGANVWLDQLDLVPGDLWDRSVEDALIECPRMLVILSPSSVSSRNVMDEVSFALETNKRLIPVVYRECKVPFRLSRIQRVDFSNDYGLALQALLLAIAPIKDSHQSEPSTDVTASKTAEQRQLEERPRKRAQGQENREKSGGAEGKTEPGFSFPWTSKDIASATIPNPAVLLTDSISISSSDLSWFVQDCKETGRPPVFVAPSIDPSVARLMKSLGGLAIRATGLTEQPVGELLGDVGFYLGGFAMLREIGFGFATREDSEEKISDGVLCSFPQMSKHDLCHARTVTTDGYSTRFEAQHPGPHVSSRIKSLKLRASRYARSDSELEGLNDRLRRFGADGIVSHRAIEEVTFERNLEEVLLPAGSASWYFATEANYYSCKIERPKILVTTCPIETRDQIIPALQQALAQADGRLVVFAPAIHEGALAIMVVNKLRGMALCLAVETADAEQLSAVAQLTGARLIDEANAEDLLQASVGAVFGDAREVVAEIGKTRIMR